MAPVLWLTGATHMCCPKARGCCSGGLAAWAWKSTCAAPCVLAENAEGETMRQTAERALADAVDTSAVQVGRSGGWASGGSSGVGSRLMAVSKAHSTVEYYEPGLRLGPACPQLPRPCRIHCVCLPKTNLHALTSTPSVPALPAAVFCWQCAGGARAAGGRHHLLPSVPAHTGRAGAQGRQRL